MHFGTADHGDPRPDLAEPAEADHADLHPRSGLTAGHHRVVRGHAGVGAQCRQLERQPVRHRHDIVGQAAMLLGEAAVAHVAGRSVAVARADADAVADPDAGDALADRAHDAGDLVADDDGAIRDVVEPGGVRHGTDVGVAQARSPDVQHDFAVARGEGAGMSARVSGSCVDVNCQAFIGLHSSVGGPSSRMVSAVHRVQVAVEVWHGCVMHYRHGAPVGGFGAEARAGTGGRSLRHRERSSASSRASGREIAGSQPCGPVRRTDAGRCPDRSARRASRSARRRHLPRAADRRSTAPASA